MWLPLVLLGSIIYWSLALGLGGMSLSFLGEPVAEELVLPAVPDDPIVVQMRTPSELRGMGGTAGIDDGTGRLPAIDQSPTPPPEDTDTIGRTSYSRGQRLREGAGWACARALRG